MAELSAHAMVAFLRKVDDFSNDEACWNWTGGGKGNGYGNAYHNGKHIGAHRKAYMLFYGPIPDGFVICHTCDNRACVNPKHLWLGTQAQNLADAVSKGRMYRPDARAEKNGNTKLTWEIVRDIRSKISDGIQQKEIARLYQIDPGTVHNIKYQKTWKEPHA